MGDAGSKSDMSFEELAHQTVFSIDEIEDWYHNFKDNFPKGRLNRDEFKTVYKKMYPGGNADQFSNDLFRAYDADGSGTINFQEFIMTMSTAASGDPEQKLKASFRMYDVDGNGFVTLQELTDMLTAIYKSKKINRFAEKANQDALTVMQKLDMTKNNKLSEAEFVRAATVCPRVNKILQLPV